MGVRAIPPGMGRPGRSSSRRNGSSTPPPGGSGRPSRTARRPSRSWATSRRASSGRLACAIDLVRARRRGHGGAVAPTASRSRSGGSVRTTRRRTRASRTSFRRICAGSGRRRGGTSARGPASASQQPAGERRSRPRALPRRGRRRARRPGGCRAGRPDTPAPVRFLPHWDNTLLVHARRARHPAGTLSGADLQHEESVLRGTYLVDGQVAGAWSAVEGRIVLDPFISLAELEAADRRAVEREREALEAFHA